MAARFCGTVRVVADSPVDPRVLREQVLARDLTTGQQTMMAVGGAIGTGLFLGSGLAVNVAGPGVVLSYVLGSFVSLLLGAALTEMCVAHPTAGSFGVYAEMYVSPFAGYAVRVSYWLMQIVATGGHMVAVSIYMRYWFPGVPGAVWIVAFSAALIYVNSRAVASLGRFEYWFAMVKVAAIAVFVVSGVALLAGWLGTPAAPDPAQTGILPRGLSGVLLAVPFVIYSFIGVEIVGVTSGEARDPERTIPAAFLRLVVGLSLIYIVTTALLVRLVPWQELGVGESPFVKVLSQIRWPFSGGVGQVMIGGVRWTPSVAGFVASLMNVVVLSAALSSANANLYLIARTLFSLGRGRLRAVVARRGDGQRRARSRAPGLVGRPGRRRRRPRAVAGLRLRLVLRRGALRRPVRLADDLRHAPRVPAASRRPPGSAHSQPGALRARRFRDWRAGHPDGATLHVVGARPAHHAGRRRALARAARRPAMPTAAGPARVASGPGRIRNRGEEN